MLKIDGTADLNRNIYNKIIIRENPEEETISVIVGNCQRMIGGIYPTIPKKFSDRIRGKSDYQKTKEIVNYFLENHQITSLQDSKIFPFYSDKFSCISSKDCFLALKLFHYRDILNNCIKKYQRDRSKFVLENEDVCNYCFHLNYKESKYEKNRPDRDEWIDFDLFTKDDSICKIDKIFLEEFIKSKLYERQEIAYIIDSDALYGFHNSGAKRIYLISGDLKIDITYLYRQISIMLEEIVNEHNCSLEKNKIKQIKMEGF